MLKSGILKSLHMSRGEDPLTDTGFGSLRIDFLCESFTWKMNIIKFICLTLWPWNNILVLHVEIFHVIMQRRIAHLDGQVRCGGVDYGVWRWVCFSVRTLATSCFDSYTVEKIVHSSASLPNWSHARGGKSVLHVKKLSVMCVFHVSIKVTVELHLMYDNHKIIRYCLLFELIRLYKILININILKLREQ